MTVEPAPSHLPSGDGGEARSPERFHLTLPELLSVIHDLSKVPPELQAEAARRLAGATSDPARPLRAVGRARKVSVSMPEDLTAAVQQRVGRGEFSQYVSEAVARQLELDLLGELSALLREEHGPVSDEALAEARNSWPDEQ